MKISLVYPVLLDQESGMTFDQLQKTAKEIQQFFQKFPIDVEYVFVVDEFPKNKTLEEIKNEFPFFASTYCQLILNPSKIGRALSIQKGLDNAKGDFLLTASIDLNIPLAEYFSFIQQIISQSEIDLLIGNRNNNKRPRLGHKKKWHKVLEDILQEKYGPRYGIQDPSCHFLAIKISAWKKMRTSLNLKSWYYSLDILKWNQKNPEFKINIQESPIQSRDSEKSNIPLLIEYFRYVAS